MVRFTLLRSVPRVGMKTVRGEGQVFIEFDIAASAVAAYSRSLPYQVSSLTRPICVKPGRGACGVVREWP
jgi:hypothetical protein